MEVSESFSFLLTILQYNSIVCAKSTHSNSSIKLGTPYPLSLFLDSSKISPSYNHFCSLITNVVELNSYHEAVLDPKWQEAMAVEIAAFDTNNTWTLTSLPPNKKVIGCKWLYKIKHRLDGSIERDKAKLATKGFTQQEGLDFAKKISLIAKMATAKVLLAIFVVKGWHLTQLDVNNAFLHGDLHEDVYMQLLQGFHNKRELVCKLNKSLYGLK